MNSDFKDLIVEFNAHHVEYLVVGAHALAAYGIVRATKDMDVWVRPSPANAARVLRALAAFGAPLRDLSEQDFAIPGVVFQIGVPPLRIDIVTAIDGVDFDEAWPQRLTIPFDDQPASVLSLEHLIQNKRVTGRLQDLADVEKLEALPDRRRD